jgi:hypothetical protein
MTGPTNSLALRRSCVALLFLAAMSQCVVAIPAFAQDLPAETAPVMGYTVPRGVATPIVMKTLPDAACDLHTVGASDVAHSLRIDANADGYFKFHVTPRQDAAADDHMQIDCTSDGKVTTYLLQVRASDAPTADMPAPLTTMPPPSGSKVLPALTESEAQSVSREELLARGYPPRPDSVASPDKYLKWRKAVSRSVTLLPAERRARTDISRRPSGVEEGPVQARSSNWSGMIGSQPASTYSAIEAVWNVPEVVAGNPTSTYSGFWIGIDGWVTSDVVQAGTEQDFINSGRRYDYAHYSAWTEIVPTEPYSQTVDITPDPGDSMTVYVWIGDAYGDPNLNGGYAWFYLYDGPQNQVVSLNVPLNGLQVSGTQAEWIMERPGIDENTQLALLTDYNDAYMTDATALNVNGVWVDAQTTSNVQATMYNEQENGTDNNELSSAAFTGPTSISFKWHNFH